MLTFEQTKKLIHNQESESFLVHKHWYEKCEKTHQEIRDIIGGVAKEYTIQIENKEYKSDAEKTIGLIKKLDSIENNNQFSTGLNTSLGSKWTELIRLPTVPNGTHRANKISYYLDLIRNRIKFSKLNSNKEYSDVLSQLGELWQKSHTKKQTLNCMIDTTIEAFAKLGTYKVDYDSCFKAGGGSAKCKYYLAEIPNSFVCIVREKDTIVSRLIGALSNNTVNFWNFYFSKVNEGNIRECLKAISADILNLDPEVLHCYEDRLELPTGYIYQNDYFNVTFARKNSNPEPALNKQYFIFNTTVKECEGCGNGYGNGAKLVDGYYYCAKCSKDATYASYNDTYTFKEIIKVRNKLYGREYTALKEQAHLFRKDSEGNYYF